MKEVILISEVVHNGEAHFQVNSCFIEMISILYPDKRIFCRAENAHIKILKANLNRNEFLNIEFLPFDRYYDEKKYYWGSRIIGECMQITKTLRKGNSLKNDLYIWTCLFPTGHFFLNFLNLFQKNKKHIIILHGELEFLKTKNKRITEILFGIILRAALYLSNSKTRYIVLGGNIKKSLNSMLGKRIFNKIHVVLHPYNYYVGENVNDFKKNKEVVIGSIGTQMLSKNSNYIYQLANSFKEDEVLKKIIFRTIGKVLPELYGCDNGLVEKLYSDSFVSQKQFEFEISKLDFVVFFYDNKAYQLCASGAVFEAIRMDIPVISIKNDFFEWLFETYGVMGFLCDDLKDMERVIEKLKMEEYTEKINEFKSNMIRFKTTNDLKSLVLNLKDIV
jgi:hypothetical protein